jgi:cytochrome P450
MLLSYKLQNPYSLVAILSESCCEISCQTVPALLYNLYCLATNPEIQEEAYQEVRRYLERDEPVTYTIINKLSYLKAVMKETFRYESQAQSKL